MSATHELSSSIGDGGAFDLGSTPRETFESGAKKSTRRNRRNRPGNPYYAVVEILSGTVLTATQSVYKAALKLEPGTVFASSHCQRLAIENAAAVAARYRESGYQPLER